MENQAIDLYDRMQNPIEAIEKLGTFFAKSGMFGCEKVEQGQVLAAACMAEKKSPLDITRKYHLLDGRLSMKSEAMLAEFKVRGGKHKIVSRTPDCASIELTSDGQSQVFSLTWEEAQKEPFPFGKENKLKKNWATPRARMQTMWARVVSDGVRAMAPEIVTGTYTPEEIEDFEPHSTTAKPIFTPPETRKENATSKPNPEPKAVSATPAPATEPAQQAVEVAGTPDAPVDVEFTDLVKKAELTPSGHLTAPTIATLQHVIGEANWAKAIEWLKAKGKIKSDNVGAELGVAMAQRIIDQPAKFLEAINGGVK